MKCLRFKSVAHSRIDFLACATVPKHFASLSEDPLGHTLYMTQANKSGVFGVLCRRCGLFSFSNLLGLRKGCTGSLEKASKGTQYRLGRIMKGLHPLGNHLGTLQKPWPLHSHDFTPAPPPLPPPPTIAIQTETPSERAVEPLLGGILVAEEEEEVDLWAEFVPGGISAG